jgi:hypothetical protein
MDNILELVPLIEHSVFLAKSIPGFNLIFLKYCPCNRNLFGLLNVNNIEATLFNPEEF